VSLFCFFCFWSCYAKREALNKKWSRGGTLGYHLICYANFDSLWEKKYEPAKKPKKVKTPKPQNPKTPKKINLKWIKLTKSDNQPQLSYTWDKNLKKQDKDSWFGYGFRNFMFCEHFTIIHGSWETKKKFIKNSIFFILQRYYPYLFDNFWNFLSLFFWKTWKLP